MLATVLGAVHSEEGTGTPASGTSRVGANGLTDGHGPTAKGDASFSVGPSAGAGVAHGLICHAREAP